MHHSRMNQGSLPFLEGLIGYADSGVVPFHTPGHKQSRGAYAALNEAIPDALRLDVSDVVASPEHNDSWFEALRAAETLAAEAFGASTTRFVANGTTGAIHAMFLAIRMLGFSHVVLPREAHLSVFAGLVLSGLQPIYVPNAVLPGWNILLQPGVREYQGASYPEGAAFFATYPTYYGIAQPLQPLSELARSANGMLLVDEAHGPHYRFHPELPPPALACGAHLVAQSTHKLLGALTQASMLHVGQYALPDSVLERALQLTQSTSPSGLLLGSLDAARAQMAREGEALWGRTLEIAHKLRADITMHLGMRVLSEHDMPDGYRLDSTRVIIRTSDREIHGVEAARLLRLYGVQVEMADPWHVVALLTLADSEATAGALYNALHQTVEECGAPATERPSLLKGQSPTASHRLWQMPTPVVRMSPREAALSRCEAVPRREAKGRISVEAICPYPPGVPVICPGEEIDSDTISYLDSVRHNAFEVRGATDPSLEYLFVVRG